MKKKPQKKPDLERARSLLQHALFDLSRLSFNLIDVLVFTSGRRGDGVAAAPSDHELHLIKMSIEGVHRALFDVVKDLRPHARKVLTNPELAFAPRCSFCNEKEGLFQHEHSCICKECVRRFAKRI